MTCRFGSVCERSINADTTGHDEAYQTFLIYRLRFETVRPYLHHLPTDIVGNSSLVSITYNCDHKLICGVTISLLTAG